MKDFKIGHIVFLISIIFSSCIEKERPDKEEIFWVYSYQLPCDQWPHKNSTCFYVSYTEEFDYNVSNLTLIPGEIEDHTFKRKFIQKLNVIKTEDSKSGEIQRKLIQVLQEERDYIDLLDGGWQVIRFQNEDLPKPGFSNYQIVKIESSTRTAVTSDGTFSSVLKLKKVDDNQIISFGENAESLIDFPGLSHRFKREENFLFFYNESNEEIAVWKKIE